MITTSCRQVVITRSDNTRSYLPFSLWRITVIHDTMSVRPANCIIMSSRRMYPPKSLFHFPTKTARPLVETESLQCQVPSFFFAYLVTPLSNGINFIWRVTVYWGACWCNNDTI
jgi:hypothetical protein